MVTGALSIAAPFPPVTTPVATSVDAHTHLLCDDTFPPVTEGVTTPVAGHIHLLYDDGVQRETGMRTSLSHAQLFIEQKS